MFDGFVHFFKQVLLEADSNKRIEYLKKKYAEKLMAFLAHNDSNNFGAYLRGVDSKAAILPALNHEVDKIISSVVKRIDSTQGTYSEWILRNILKLSKDQYQRFWGEDESKLADDIADYHRYKYLFKQLAQEENKPEIARYTDINQIKGFVELYNALQLIDSHITAADAEEEMKGLEKEVEKVYDSENYLILIPKTEEASCAYGRQTRWCTASTGSYNYFNQYNREGPLYIIIDKKNNEKFQFHFQSNQFMDKNDKRLNLKEFFENHTEVLRPLFHESLKQNNDILISFFPVSELIKMAEENKNYIEKFIKNNALFSIEYSDKDENLVNELQNVYNFQAENVKINVSNKIAELQDFVEYLIEDNSQEFCKKIIEGDHFWNYYHRASKYEKISDIVDHLNEKNKELLQSYLKKRKMKISDLWEDEQPEELIEVLKHSYDDAYISATETAYYNAVMSSIDEAVGNFEFIKEGVILNWTKRRLKNTINDSLEYAFESDEPESLELYATDFMNAYHQYLKDSDQLENPTLDHVYADSNDIEKAFNDRFPDLFHEEGLDEKISENEKSSNILQLCLESLKNN